MSRTALTLMIGLAVWAMAGGGALAAREPAEAPPSTAEISQRVLVFVRLPTEHFRPGGSYGDSYGDGMGRSARRRMADGIARRHGLTLVTDWALPVLGVDCFVMQAPAGRSAEAAAEALSHDPGVAWSEPMRLYRAQAAPAPPNDPLFRVQPAAAEWRLADLHQLSTGRSVRVAVIDSMVEARHPDLLGQVSAAENFVDGASETTELHGTGVAGIIAARADNGVGIAGVAPEARLLALRACWEEPGAPGAGAATVCDSLSLAKALHFAITHDAQVINMSLSGPYDPVLGKLIDAALKRGATVVAAYDRDLPRGGFPASQAGVVAVTEEGTRPAPSGVLAAPGRDVPTSQPGGRWYLVSGSSYAAAHVSGLFALVREKIPRSRTAEAIVATAGRIDACATLLRGSGPCGCACASAPQYASAAHR